MDSSSAANGVPTGSASVALSFGSAVFAPSAVALAGSRTFRLSRTTTLGWAASSSGLD